MPGYVLHQDDQRVVIATRGRESEANSKTGFAWQVYILAVKYSPIDLIRRKRDSLVCGTCKLAGTFAERACYVRIDQGPQGVWKAWKRGRYAFLPRCRYAEVFSGSFVRWGAYGDPAFIPRDVVSWVSFFADGHTGYTHQWASPAAAWLKDTLMASVDTPEEYAAAKRAGWRTFRARPQGAAILKGEIGCPAAPEQGSKTQCNKCKLCDGLKHGVADPRKDITVEAHGIFKQRFETLIQIGRLAA
jgi:hypothetical protein